jgi:hypothetical protein
LPFLSGIHTVLLSATNVRVIASSSLPHREPELYKVERSLASGKVVGIAVDSDAKLLLGESREYCNVWALKPQVINTKLKFKADRCKVP